MDIKNDIDFIKKIKNVTENIFINLNKKELQIILYEIINLLHTIYIKFNFNYNNFKEQLIYNDYLDLKTIILYLFPYIDKKNNYENFKK